MFFGKRKKLKIKKTVKKDYCGEKKKTRKKSMCLTILCDWLLKG